MKLTFDELNKRYEDMTLAMRCNCTFRTEMVAGQPADEDGLRGFVVHHLKLTDEAEIKQAIDRIKLEELGVSVMPEEGEIPEKRTYGVRALRRDEYGVWLGDWMIKACMKQAASRLGIFISVPRSKGAFAESGRVIGLDDSYKNIEHPEQIYITLSKPAYFKEFMGRVQTPTGPVSIIHNSECVAPGSTFSWEYRLPKDKLKIEDVRDVLAMSMICGLGSSRSLERGHFSIDEAEIIEASQPRTKTEKAKKDAVAA